MKSNTNTEERDSRSSDGLVGVLFWIERVSIVVCALSIPILWILPDPYFYYSGMVGLMFGVIGYLLFLTRRHLEKS